MWYGHVTLPKAAQTCYTNLTGDETRRDNVRWAFVLIGESGEGEGGCQEEILKEQIF
jgi:hypothetical protein